MIWRGAFFLSTRAAPVILLHLFFLIMGLLFIALWSWRYVDARASFHQELRYRGEIALRSIADQLASNLDGHFHDLTFFRRSLLELNDHPLVLTPGKKAAMRAFQKTHSGIVAINMLDRRAKKIIWSSSEQWSTPLLQAGAFTQLKRNPDYLVGQPVLSLPDKVWVMPMREHLLNRQGQVTGYIGSPFRLSQLKNIHTPADMDIQIMGAGQIPVAFWRRGVWQNPAPQERWAGNSLQVAVPGYPWTASARWSPEMISSQFWQQNVWQGLPFVIILCVLLLLDRLSVGFLRQLLDLRQYQQAALLTQQSLLVLAEPEAMYARLVQDIVHETRATAAWLMMPDHKTGFWQLMALEADGIDLQESLQVWFSAWSPNGLRDEHFLPARVLRSGRAEEFRFSEALVGSPELPENRPALRRLHSMIAYPIYTQDDEQQLVLIVASAATRHFSQPLKMLIGQLASSMGLTLTLWRRHHDLTNAEAEIRKIAFYDSLTGLANRRLFNEQLAKALTLTCASGQAVALGILDVDDFKGVNDQYGHDAGDALLVIIARRLEEALRASDCVARWGGDEFVLLFEGLPSRRVLEEVLARLERIMDSPAKLSDRALLPLRISLGVCFCENLSQLKNQDDLFRCADQALYAMKAQKRTRDHFWMVHDLDDRVTD